MFKPRVKQQEVLDYTGGKMGVAAVPGSGKTETLARLAAKIITSGWLDSYQEVLVVTLVNSAVDNFYRRVSGLVKQRGMLPHVGYRVRTLHGLSHEIVRERPALLGLDSEFSILDERVATEIRQDAAKAWLRSHPDALDGYLSLDVDENKRDWIRRTPLPALIDETALAFIRLAKDREVSPEDLRERLDDLVIPLPLAEMGWAIYADYQRALAYRGSVDFDDLIRLALKALNLDEGMLARLRDRWPYVLEDEAQDSSRLQEEILRLLVGEQGNWVRVGDPNQAIYETFTTASPEYLRRFLAEPGVQSKELPDSGRSAGSIIDLANYLVDWTRESHSEPAVRDALTLPYILPTAPGDSQPNPPDAPGEIHLMARKYSPAAEIKAVADSLARWVPEHAAETVAVLVPRNTRGFELVDLLRQRGIEVVDSLLRSTASTREAAGSLSHLLRYLAEPVSSVKLATAFKVWRRDDKEDQEAWAHVNETARILRKCPRVEDYLWPRAGRDWLASLDLDGDRHDQLLVFRELVQRWQGLILLPVDQVILSLAQDLFSEQTDLAIAHKLALLLRQASMDHPEWRLPELAEELAVIARNERRFIGFSDDDIGFDPDRHKGKVVVSTMHKAKGLEWDRVYLMSVNSYDFPSAQPYDQYIAEKWFVRDQLNLSAEALAQLNMLTANGDTRVYREGSATQDARLEYVRERLRLFYVGVTRAKRSLIITWNSGRKGDLTQALPFVALQTHWEDQLRDSAS
ncbi:MAG: ATP-dependent helicase [Chloroflexota bacterium]|nr:ATP-dependent helicase [Chloroflexota bacterium]